MWVCQLMEARRLGDEGIELNCLSVKLLTTVKVSNMNQSPLTMYAVTVCASKLYSAIGLLVGVT